MGGEGVMGEAYFKRCERELRRRWRGERAVHLGEKGADGVIIGWLRWELKCRERLPQWILAALAQAKVEARPNELSIAVLKEKWMPWRPALVVMELGDFEDWFGGECQSAHQKAMLEMAKEESDE